MEYIQYNFPTQYGRSEVDYSPLRQGIGPCPAQRAGGLIGSQIFIGNEETCRKLTVSRDTSCCRTHEVARLHTVEDCRTRASRPPQTHCRYKAVDGPSSRYTAQSILSHPISSHHTLSFRVVEQGKQRVHKPWYVADCYFFSPLKRITCGQQSSRRATTA